MMFVKTGSQLMAVRFFLGCAEAGFVPGVFLYLTYWYAVLTTNGSLYVILTSLKGFPRQNEQGNWRCLYHLTRLLASLGG